MSTISDKEAEILLNAYKNKEKIFGQDARGDAMIVFIKNGCCTVRFENGDIEEYSHNLFHQNI